MNIELIIGSGAQQRREIQLPGVPRIGDTVCDEGGDETLGEVYAVLWIADADVVQVRVR